MSAKRSIREDYLAGAPRLRPFYAFDFPETDFRQALLARQKYPVDRGVLADALAAQYDGLPDTVAVSANIELLRRDTTFTITTGQQPGLYGGPMYTLYKSLTAIQLAENLKARMPEYDFVPVFWVASEDHDYAEVNHTYFDYGPPVQYSGAFAGAVGRHVITPNMLETPVRRPELREFYRPGVRWGDAFRDWLHHLFGADGLVVLDADERALKARFAPVMARELLHRGGGPAVELQSEALAAENYPLQLHPRPINLFYLDNAGRNRLVYDERAGKFGAAGREITFTEDSLRQALNETPECFSPNAALRPVYQEKLLPNLAYVGGWGEIAYWMQLKPLFSLYEAFFPALEPRASALLVTSKQEAALVAHDVPLARALRPWHELKRWLALREWDDAPLRELEAEADALFARWAAYAESLEPSLRRTAAGFYRKHAKFQEHFRRKIANVLVSRRQAELRPALDARAAIQPDGFVQERTLNVQAWAGRPPREIVAVLRETLKPFDYDRQIVRLEE